MLVTACSSGTIKACCSVTGSSGRQTCNLLAKLTQVPGVPLATAKADSEELMLLMLIAVQAAAESRAYVLQNLTLGSFMHHMVF